MGHEPLTWEVRKQGWEEGGGRVWKKTRERAEGNCHIEGSLGMRFEAWGIIVKLDMGHL